MFMVKRIYCTHFVIVGHAFFVVCQSIHIVSTTEREGERDLDRV